MLFFKLSKFSQEWADQLASVDKASHRPKNVYGENIFIIKSSAPVTELGIRAVDSWYDEIKYFNFQGTNDEMTASTKSRNFCTIFHYDFLCLLRSSQSIFKLKATYL